MAKARGHQVMLTTATAFQSAVEAAGVQFFPLKSAANFDFRDMAMLFPERTSMIPGPEMMRFDYERVFIDTMLPQAETLMEIVASEAPNVIVADTFFCGTTPLFLDPKRAGPPIVVCGITFLPLDRPDFAPTWLGLPPARDSEERRKYNEIAKVFDQQFTEPVQSYANAKLASVGLPPVPVSFTQARVVLADAYLQPTIPTFEYDFGDLPANLRFIGALPPPSHSESRPTWWSDLDGTRKIVLVTQGTVANYDLSQLIEPTLKALANRDDLLVVATTGGRPVESITGPIPSNARLATFLPFDELLPKTDVLVTNGGYGTVTLALRAGVPIVSAGKTEDKAEISARVSWSGTGVDVGSNTPSADTIRSAVNEILTRPSYASRARSLANDFKTLNSENEIFAVIDLLVREAERPEPTFCSD